MKYILKIISIIGVIISTTLLSGAVYATTWTIKDDNSLATIDTESQDGMNNWKVDGVAHLYQQWFWYRAGTMTKESSIDTLNIDNERTSDGDFDSDDETLTVIYTDSSADSPATFELQIKYILDGGAPGSGTSGISEQISINNLTTSALEFHFFQYTDLDLNDTPNNDSAEFISPNTMRQTDPTTTFSETVTSPSPDHWQIDVPNNILNSLNDGSSTTLSDTTTPLGPADITWAFQWDFNISAGGTAQISKSKQIVAVTEPSAFTLLVIGIVGVIGMCMVRSEKKRLNYF